MKVLVTGGAGFIGSNFIRHLLSGVPKHGIDIVNLDALTYAGNLENLAGLPREARYRFVKGDVTRTDDVFGLLAEGFDVVVHFAAESHVDRSIEDSHPFMRTNVLGTQTLLEAIRQFKVSRFLHISTDEVYGPVPVGAAREDWPLKPSSPYAASKAAADHLVAAYHHTYGLPVVVARSSNNYGPYQFPEKLIPLLIINAARNLPLPLYGDGSNVRDWLHVEDHCRALAQLMCDGRPGEVYNIGGHCLRTNLEVARLIVEKLGRPRSLIKFVADRPGHDYRYALDASKIQRELGWLPRIDFEQGIEATIAWYQQNEPWWRRIVTGEYARYYERQYGPRLKL